MVMYSYVWLCRVMYGYVVLCIAMYGYVQGCSQGRCIPVEKSGEPAWLQHLVPNL